MTFKLQSELPFLPTSQEEAKLKNLWLIRLRSFAVCCQITILGLAFSLNKIEPKHAAIVLVIMVAIGVFNLYIHAAKHIALLFSEWYIFAQLAFDLSAFTAMLSLTGGLSNPFCDLIYLHLTLGAMMLNDRFAWIFAAITFASLILLAAAMPEPFLWPETFFVLAPRTVVVVVSFLLVSYLAVFLRNYRDHLIRIQSTKMKLDHLHGIGALTAGICHELHTPLNTISLRLQRISKRTGPTEDSAVAEKALKNCFTALRNLLDTKSDQEKLEFKPVDLSLLLMQVVEEWQFKNPKQAVVITNEMTYPITYLPRASFANVLLDLLDNAAEAMAEVEKASIGILLKDAQDFLQLQIMDRGTGWPEMVKQYFGEPFVTTKSSGIGLGLYNAHLLVGSVGGKLKLQDRQGGGAVVSMDLPRYKVESP